jgi:hypothetical protein
MHFTLRFHETDFVCSRIAFVFSAGCATAVFGMSVTNSFYNRAEYGNLVKALGAGVVAATMPGSVEKAATREVWNGNAKEAMEALMQGSILRVGPADALAYYVTDDVNAIDFPANKSPNATVSLSVDGFKTTLRKAIRSDTLGKFNTLIVPGILTTRFGAGARAGSLTTAVGGHPVVAYAAEGNPGDLLLSVGGGSTQRHTIDAALEILGL